MTPKVARKSFVEAGKPVGLLGGTYSRCAHDAGTLLVPPDERWGNPVFADACLDDSDFHIHATLTLERLTATGASMLLGGHYHYHFSRPEGNLTFRISLDDDIHPAQKALDKQTHIVHGRTDPYKPWHMRENLHEKVVVGAARDFFEPGKPFTLDLHRRGNELTCLINGREAFRTDLSDGSRIAAGRCGDPGWPMSVGFLPGRGTLRIHEFYAEGSFPGPAFPTTDAWLHNTGGYSIYRIPSLCRLTNGRLLAFNEARRSHLTRGWQWHMMKASEILSGEVHCAMKSSDDGGRTWSEQTIIPTLKRGTVYEARDPVPLQDRETGELFLFTRGPWVVSSRDEGRTWSRPRSLAPVLPGDWTSLTSGTGNGAIQLQHSRFKGRLISVFYGGGIVLLLLSDDHGVTWRAGAMWPSCKLGEPSMAELSDGRVLVSPRRAGKLSPGRWFLTSHDGGMTFAEERSEPVLPMAGQGEIVAAETLEIAGKTVRPIICCGPAQNKTRLTMAVSLDDGKTWPISRVIDDGSASNLALVALPDGHVGVLYERDKYRRLSFQRVDLRAVIEPGRSS
jgi:sialidase-1